jgi:hypothetical protein
MREGWSAMSLATVFTVSGLFLDVVGAIGLLIFELPHGTLTADGQDVIAIPATANQRLAIGRKRLGVRVSIFLLLACFVLQLGGAACPSISSSGRATSKPAEMATQ